MFSTKDDYVVPKRHADPTTVDHLIALTKECNRLRRALMDISHLDGSDATTDLQIARRIARNTLFPEQELPK